MEPSAPKYRKLNDSGQRVHAEDLQEGLQAGQDVDRLPQELLQTIARLVPTHQRGAMSLVCRSWCGAVSHDVPQLQLPLMALAPLPQWQVALVGSSEAARRDEALQRLFSRFPHAKHLVLMHNVLLPPASVQAALSRLPQLCPAVRHVEFRDSVSWEQPAALAPLVASVAAAAGDDGAGGGSGGGAAATCGSGGSGASGVPRELTLTFLASPDMQRITRRWFSRELERLVSPDWALEKLRVRWLMGEAPRAFFTSRGFTRWANAMAALDPSRLDLVQSLEFAWAELSDSSFERREPAQPAAGAGAAAAPPLPPWILEPYQAPLPPAPPQAAAGMPQPLGPFGPLGPAQPLVNGPLLLNGPFGGDPGIQAAAAVAAIMGGEHGNGDAVFQAAMDGQMEEEEASMAGGPAMDGWNTLGRADASATAALGLRGLGSGGGGWDREAVLAGTGAAGAPRLGLPLALCMFTNLKNLSLCCMACRAPADHLLRLLLRCRRLEKLSLVHHEAYASWPVRRPQPDLQEVLRAVVQEELGTQPAPVNPPPTLPAATTAGPSTSTSPAPAGASTSTTSSGTSWWPAGLSLRLRELQLPATPALLTLLHLPAPALARMEVLDLQAIMATGYGGGLLHAERPMVGTARLVAALRAVHESGAQLRDLFLNNMDLSPSLLDTISELESLEQLLVFSGEITLRDRDSEPGSEDGDLDAAPLGGGGGDEDNMDEDDSDGSDSEGSDDPFDGMGMMGMMQAGGGAGAGGGVLGGAAGMGPVPMGGGLGPGMGGAMGPMGLQWPPGVGGMAGPMPVGILHGLLPGQPFQIAGPHMPQPIPLPFFWGQGMPGLQQPQQPQPEAQAQPPEEGVGLDEQLAAAILASGAEEADDEGEEEGEPSAMEDEKDGGGVGEQQREDKEDDGQKKQGGDSGGAAAAATGDPASGAGPSGSQAAGGGGGTAASSGGSGGGGGGLNLPDVLAGLGSSWQWLKKHKSQVRTIMGSAAAAGPSRLAATACALAALAAAQDKPSAAAGTGSSTGGSDAGGATAAAATGEDAVAAERGVSNTADGAGPSGSGAGGTAAGPSGSASAPLLPSQSGSDSRAALIRGIPPLPPRRNASACRAGASGAGPSCGGTSDGSGDGGGNSGGDGGGSAAGGSGRPASGASGGPAGPVLPSPSGPATEEQRQTNGGDPGSGAVNNGGTAEVPTQARAQVSAEEAPGDAMETAPAAPPVLTGSPPAEQENTNSTGAAAAAPVANAAAAPAAGMGAGAAVAADGLNAAAAAEQQPPQPFMISTSPHAKLYSAMAMCVVTLSAFVMACTIPMQLRDGAAATAATATAAGTGTAAAAGGGAGADAGTSAGALGNRMAASLRQLSGAAMSAVWDVLTGDVTQAAVRQGLSCVRSLHEDLMGIMDSAQQGEAATRAQGDPGGGGGGRQAAGGADAAGSGAAATAAGAGPSTGTSSDPGPSSSAAQPAPVDGYGSGRDGDGGASGPSGPRQQPQPAAAAATTSSPVAPPAAAPSDIASMVAAVYGLLSSAGPTLRTQVASLEEGQSALLRSLCSGSIRPGTPQAAAAVAALQAAAQVAETLDAAFFASHVAARLVGCGEGVGAAAASGSSSSKGSGEEHSATAAAAAAAAATDPEAVVEAYRAGRPAGPLRCGADEGVLVALNLASLTRLTRLRKLCLDFSPDNREALPVGSAIRLLLRKLPSLESLHVTDLFPHPEDKSLGSLGLPHYGPDGAAAGPTSLYDSGFGACGGGVAAANKLTSLTVASRQARRVLRPYAADGGGGMLMPGAGDAAAAGAPHLMALLMPLDRTALSGAMCSCDMLVHWGTLPRNLRALCLHRVRMVASPESHLSTVQAQQQEEQQQKRPAEHQDQPLPGAARMELQQPQEQPQQLPQSTPVLPLQHRQLAIPPLLQHLWLSNVTLAAPLDFAGLLRQLLAAVPASGGLQTLVVRHCFVIRPKQQRQPDATGALSAAGAVAAGCSSGAGPSGSDSSGNGGGGNGSSAQHAADITAVRVLSSALATLADIGNGSSRHPRLLEPWAMWPPQDIGAVTTMAAAAAAHDASTVAAATGGPRLPQRLVLGEEDLGLLCEMKSLRTLGLDSCIRLEDVGRLTALCGLRTLALNPNVVASEEARARLDLELASRCSPALLAAVMRLAPLTGLRGLWLPDWAGSRAQLLSWQSQLAAAGPALVALRVMDHDNLWRLATPAGCPDVEDSLQWWQAEVWNTI